MTTQAQGRDSNTSPTPFTAIITGISPISPLSHSIISALIKCLHDTPLSSTPDSTRKRPLSIALLGPDHSHLEATIASLSSPSSSTSHHELQNNSNSNNKVNTNNALTLLPIQCTLSSIESLGLASHQIRATLGAWDLFIHNPSAHLSSESEIHRPATIRGSDADTWWNVFETNVHALHHVARHFFPKMKSGATFVALLPATSTAVLDGLTSDSSVLNLDLLRGHDGGSKENASAEHPSSKAKPTSRPGMPSDLRDRRSAEHAAARAASTVIDYLAAEHAESGLKCLKAALPLPLVGAEDAVAMKVRTEEAAAYAKEIAGLILSREGI